MYEWQPGALLLLWMACKFFSHLFSEVLNAGTLMMKKKSYKLRYLHTNEDRTIDCSILRSPATDFRYSCDRLMRLVPLCGIFLLI